MIADFQQSPATTWLLKISSNQLRGEMLRRNEELFFDKENVILDCSLVKIGKKLYLIHHENKKLLEHLAGNKSKVDSSLTVIMVTMIDNTLVETVRANLTPYEGYKCLKQSFSTDKYLES